jgi:NDP-sugar pyrophosphorylase family protein
MYPFGEAAEYLPELFTLEAVEHVDLIMGNAFPWAAIPKIETYIRFLLKEKYHPGLHSSVPQGSFFGPQVYLGPGCTVDQGVCVKGPAWIGAGCILRHGLYCKENVLIEAGCFLGHASELKNCYLMSGAEVPHFNYVGDSILGRKAHLGAGVVLSNVRLDKHSVRVYGKGKIFDTHLQKFGAIIGDECEIGCNSVINPGSVIGRGSILYPLSCWKGVMDEKSIYDHHF